MMEFYSERLLTAQKLHICELCNNPIDIGCKYYRESGKFDGEFFDRCLHTHCHNAEVEYCREVDTVFNWSQIIDYIQEVYCGECEKLDECNRYPNIMDCSNIQNIFKYKIICIQCKFSEDLDVSEIGKFVDGTIICTRDNPPKYVMLDNSCPFAEAR